MQKWKGKSENEPVSQPAKRELISSFSPHEKYLYASRSIKWHDMMRKSRHQQNDFCFFFLFIARNRQTKIYWCLKTTRQHNNNQKTMHPLHTLHGLPIRFHINIEIFQHFQFFVLFSVCLFVAKVTSFRLITTSDLWQSSLSFIKNKLANKQSSSNNKPNKSMAHTHTHTRAAWGLCFSSSHSCHCLKRSFVCCLAKVADDMHVPENILYIIQDRRRIKTRRFEPTEVCNEWHCWWMVGRGEGGWKGEEVEKKTS